MPYQWVLDDWYEGWRSPSAEISFTAALKARQRLTVWRDHWHC
ncbi:hypothetical protein N8Z70_02705 [Candidatus Puniceispirillum sp.]|nr:hypothetical protein [Alphaproteobacteria bacterium]MDC1293936.1 hypothetical protein [Candidatus Puniceispirillum sp.]